MVERKNYHVTKTTNGWQAKLENTSKASVTGETQKEVIAQTVALVLNKYRTYY